MTKLPENGMLVGVDVGYADTKAVRGTGSRHHVRFPSVVGTPQQSRFGFNGGDEIIFLRPDHVQVGAGAIEQSYTLERREDRDWIESSLWMNCFYGALTELTPAINMPVKVITGLPLAYFDDKDRLKARLLGEHPVERLGRGPQVFHVLDCKVLPQPFGSLLYVAMDENGVLVSERHVNGKVGVVDVGGGTTNILFANELSERRKYSTSISTGVWSIVRNMKDFLDENYTDLNLSDHEIVQAIQDGYVAYYGNSEDLREPVREILTPFAESIVATANQWWEGGAAGLSDIIITGGGANLLGDTIKDAFGFGTIVDNPEYANAEGFLRFAHHLWGYNA